MKTDNILRFIREYNGHHNNSDSIEYKTDFPSSNLSTFKIGGAADIVLYPSSAASLAEVCTYLKKTDVRFMIIGKGSNLLFSDKGYRGAIISTSGLASFSESTETRTITAECGVPLTLLSAAAARASFKGLEFAYGIPGSVGGALYMNAGAYGGSVSDYVDSVTAFDSEACIIKTLKRQELDFAYRHSIFSEYSKLIALNASFTLENGNEEVIRSQMEEFMQRRKDKQPLDYPSAGSVFKRSEGHIIAQMIDEAGLKGTSIGGAEISKKHAGFIINKGRATADDVKQLIEIVQKRLYELYCVTVELEIIIVSEA